MSDEYIAGSVLSVLRYPVKSMMGEELTAADVMEGGLVGDRAFALIDNSTGKIASAKNPRKWARLFDCHASFIEPPRKGHPMPPVWIMLPDGSNITSDQPNANAVLSRFSEREVTLAKTAPDSPALEEYWPDIDGLAHRETVTDESIALLRRRPHISVAEGACLRATVQCGVEDASAAERTRPRRNCVPSQSIGSVGVTLRRSGFSPYSTNTS